MTMTTTRRTARQLTRALLARGYRPGAPDRLPEVTRHLERTFFARHMACQTCGHAHADYRPVWANPAVNVTALFPRRATA